MALILAVMQGDIEGHEIQNSGGEAMLKERAKGFVMGALTMALLSSTIVFASGVMREVHYGVNVTVNGVRQNFATEDRPFIADGRTFLPVRAISEALGQPVTWDAATSTVYIGSRTTVGAEPAIAPAPAAQAPAPVSTPTPIAETTARPSIGPSMTPSSAVTLNSAASQREFNRIRLQGGTTYRTTQIPSTSRSASGWMDFHIDGVFHTLTGTLDRLYRSSSVVHATSTVRFFGDGRELASFEVGGDTVAMDISVDVTGVMVLRFEVEQPARGPTVGFANAMIE